MYGTNLFIKIPKCQPCPTSVDCKNTHENEMFGFWFCSIHLKIGRLYKIFILTTFLVHNLYQEVSRLWFSTRPRTLAHARKGCLTLVGTMTGVAAVSAYGCPHRVQ